MIKVLEQAWNSAVSDIGTQKSFAAKEPINFQGEHAEYVGFIISGSAKAITYSENGEETWLGQFSEGEFFGHMSFLMQLPVSFEITAEDNLTALILPVQKLNALLDDHSELGLVLAKDLAQRLDMMINRLVEALTLSAKGRICAELIRLSNPIGIDPQRHVIRPNPVFVELALRVNSTRETVSRTVSDLQKKGVVSRTPGALIVEYPERLKAAISQY